MVRAHGRCPRTAQRGKKRYTRSVALQSRQNRTSQLCIPSAVAGGRRHLPMSSVVWLWRPVPASVGTVWKPEIVSRQGLSDARRERRSAPIRTTAGGAAARFPGAPRRARSAGPAGAHRPADQQGHRAAPAGALAVPGRARGRSAPRVPVHQRRRLRRAGATTFRWRSVRSRLRRRSMPSAWGVRSRRSRRPGCTRSPIRSRRSSVSSPPCQAVVIKGETLRGPGKGLARAAGADLDAGLRCRALSHRHALRDARPRHRHPEHGHLSRRLEGDRPARRAHGVAHRRRRRLSALAETQQTPRADAVRHRHRLRAGRDVHRAA